MTENTTASEALHRATEAVRDELATAEPEAVRETLTPALDPDVVLVSLRTDTLTLPPETAIRLRQALGYDNTTSILADMYALVIGAAIRKRQSEFPVGTKGLINELLKTDFKDLCAEVGFDAVEALSD